MKKIIIVFFAILFVSSCSDKSPTTPSLYSVEYSISDTSNTAIISYKDEIGITHNIVSPEFPFTYIFSQQATEGTELSITVYNPTSETISNIVMIIKTDNTIFKEKTLSLPENSSYKLSGIL